MSGRDGRGQTKDETNRGRCVYPRALEQTFLGRDRQTDRVGWSWPDARTRVGCCPAYVRHDGRAATRAAPTIARMGNGGCERRTQMAIQPSSFLGLRSAGRGLR